MWLSFGCLFDSFVNTGKPVSAVFIKKTTKIEQFRQTPALNTSSKRLFSVFSHDKTVKKTPKEAEFVKKCQKCQEIKKTLKVAVLPDFTKPPKTNKT